MAGKKKNKSSQQQTTALVVRKSTLAQPAPAAMATKVKRKAPKVNFDSNGDCTVAHTEYMFDVDAQTGGGFRENHLVNPQNPTVFTWLSAIATRFEMYRFTKLKFTFKPSSGTDVNGFVVFGFDFDPYDNTEPTKIEMLAWRYSAKCAPWQTVSVDCSPDSKMAAWRYADGGSATNAGGTLSTRGDLRFDYLGRLCLLAVADSTLSIGEMFVEYVVKFRQPSYKVPPSLYAEVKNSTKMTTPSDWFNSTTTFPGNMNFTIIDENTLEIYNAGSWLLNTLVSTSLGLTGGITVTMSTPSDNPSAKGDYTVFNNDANGTSHWVSNLGRVNVEVPPMRLNFSDVSGSGDFNRWLTFATYAASNVI